MIRLLFWLSVLGITIASLVPVGMLPPHTLDVWDKAQHAIAFAWLGLCGLLAYPKQLLRVVPGLLLLGGAIELAQSATGWRYGEWLDFAADAIGIAFAVAVWLLWHRRAPAGP